MFRIGFAAALFTVAFSANVLAKDVLSCGSGYGYSSYDYSIERYNKLKGFIQKRPAIFLIHNLGIVSLCMGKDREGMGHLQKAADAGYIGSVYLLGLYFKLNQTFNSSEANRTHSLQDLNAALEYYNRAANLIDSRPDYPFEGEHGTAVEGGTSVNLSMDQIEYHNYTSYYVFATLPELYFRGYDKAIENILESEEKLDYTDAFEVLSKMQSSAERCLKRPSLAGWEDKREAVYEVQQFRCQAYLDYAKAVFPLEKERAKTVRTCENRLSKCEAHQEVLHEINGLKDIMIRQINSIPAEFRRH